MSDCLLLPFDSHGMDAGVGASSNRSFGPTSGGAGGLAGGGLAGGGLAGGGLAGGSSGAVAGDPSAVDGFDMGRADAVQWLRSLPDASVDLVVTDPPYESLEKHRAIGTTTRLKRSKASSNDWFSIFPNHRFPELFQQIYRVMKKHRHFYLFCDQETMFVAKPLAEAAGFKFWKPLIWDKKKIGMGYHYRSRYELILFFEKGKRKLTDLAQSDILECPRIHSGYPSQKPTPIIDTLIRQSTQPGELVIDPFMGSGSSGVSAVTQGRRFMGCDVCEEAVAISTSRLTEAIDGSSTTR